MEKRKTVSYDCRRKRKKVKISVIIRKSHSGMLNVDWKCKELDKGGEGCGLKNCLFAEKAFREKRDV